MYINLEILKKHNLTLLDFTVLQLIKQNKTEDLSVEIKNNSTPEMLEKFGALKYVEYVKGKKSQTDLERIRTSKKGNNLLDAIGTYGICENSLRIYEWVKSIYLNLEKEIGNQKKCKQYIAQFSAESGICKNDLALLINHFLRDDREMEYSQRLEYLFHKGSSVFSVKFDLNQSRLYQYYQKNQKFFDSKFAELENKQ